MWDNIRDLRIMRDTINDMKKKQKECGKPVLTDISMMTQVVRWFDSYNATRQKPFKKGRSGYNEMATIVLLYYFVPVSLASYNIPRNFRREIAKVLDCEPTYISRKKKNATFLYMNDKFYHRDMDDAVNYIDERIKEYNESRNGGEE